MKILFHVLFMPPLEFLELTLAITIPIRSISRPSNKLQQLESLYNAEQAAREDSDQNLQATEERGKDLKGEMADSFQRSMVQNEDTGGAMDESTAAQRRFGKA